MPEAKSTATDSTVGSTKVLSGIYAGVIPSWYERGYSISKVRMVHLSLPSDVKLIRSLAVRLMPSEGVIRL